MAEPAWIRSHWSSADRVDFLLVATAIAGWAVLAWSGINGAFPLLCGSPGYGVTILSAAQFALLVNGPGVVVLELVAMALLMAPLMAMPLRHIRARSFNALRPWASLSFGLVFLGTWSLASLVCVCLVFLLRALAGESAFAFGVPFMVAVIWQLSPWKQRSLNRCHHRPPLAAFGTTALASAGAYGLRSALWCFASCWAIMLLALLCGSLHHLAMAVAVALALIERLYPPKTPRWSGPPKIARRFTPYRNFGETRAQERGMNGAAFARTRP